MRLTRGSAAMVVDAPAKLNLFFEVLAKRVDGYHEIETLMCPIDLYDTLVLHNEPDGRIQLHCQGTHGSREAGWLRDVPEGPENLVLRAVELLRRHTGVRSGASVRLIKRIPTAAGLGGGSSDAAAALAAADRLWGTRCPAAELSALGAQLGSDVPFFLENRAAVCRGRGERIEPAAAWRGPLCFVVVRPPVGLSTAPVYGRCRPADQPRRVEPLVAALARGDWPRAGRLLFNRLEPAAASLTPWIDRLRGEFGRLDCAGHAMSGSGSSYFGLCRHARHAQRVARQLRAKGAGSVFAVRSCS